MAFDPRPHDVRVTSRIDRRDADECWPWTGSIDREGYGVCKGADGRQTGAHRVVYELLRGPIPEGLTLDHACHSRDLSCAGGTACPHRPCVNPAHMEPMTHQQNMLRSRSFAATNALKTHCPAGHALEGDNLVASKLPWRICKACKYAANAARAKRKSA